LECISFLSPNVGDSPPSVPLHHSFPRDEDSRDILSSSDEERSSVRIPFLKVIQFHLATRCISDFSETFKVLASSARTPRFRSRQLKVRSPEDPFSILASVLLELFVVVEPLLFLLGRKLGPNMFKSLNDTAFFRVSIGDVPLLNSFL